MGALGPLGSVPTLALRVVLAMNRRGILLIGLLAVAGGCTTGQQRADTGPTPAQVVASGEARGAVHWGGQIVAVENQRDSTRIEVLALPLGSDGRPQLDAQSQGRFVVDRPGFLEPHEYAPNRLLEVQGQLDGFTRGQVGEAAYRYPLVRADRLVLWPEGWRGYGWGTPRINFGVGVSNDGGGVGIGIGF